MCDFEFNCGPNKGRIPVQLSRACTVGVLKQVEDQEWGEMIYLLRGEELLVYAVTFEFFFLEFFFLDKGEGCGWYASCGHAGGLSCC